MATLSNLIVRIGASTDDFDKKVNASLNKIKRFSSDVAQAGQSLAIGFSAPLIAAGAASLSAAADIEKLEKGLSATMKSTAAASKEFERLKDLAKLPGIGLEEAVKGSIRLQSLGTSAADARRILGELGNALGIVGGTRADFSEVVKQLSQLGAVGKVTKENLDPIIERIPQLSAIIKEKFGAAALGDPAETFKKLGISSQEFIKIMVDELAKGARAGNTFSNSLENLKDLASQTAAEFGKVLLPIAQKVIDDFLTPGLEKAKGLSQEFANLSDGTKNVVIGTSALAAALPIVVVVLGTVAEKSSALIQVVMKLGSTLGGAEIAASRLGVAAAGLFLAFQNYQDVVKIVEAFKEFKFQATALVSAGKEAKENIQFLFDQIKIGIPFSNQLGAAFKFLKTALDDISASATRPGTQVLLKTLELLTTTMELATGRSRSMEESIKGNIGRSLEFAAASNKAVLESNALGESAKRLRDGYSAVSVVSQDAIMASVGIKNSYQDLQKEIANLREAEKSLMDLRSKGASGAAENLALVQKAIAEKLKQAAAGAKPEIDALTNAFERLGVVNSTDFIGKFVQLRSAFEKVKQAFAEGKVSSVDLQRSTESLNVGFSELRTGLGAVPFAVEKVAASFDFARERAMLAMGDISTAFNAARNLSLSQVIVPGGQANNPVLDEAQNRAAGKRGIDFARENIKDALSEYQKAQAKIRQAVSTITTDFSRGIADIILNGGKIAALFEKLGKQIANTLIRTVIELGINQVVKSLAGLLVSLGGVAAKVGVAFGGQAAAVGASAASTAAAQAAASSAAAKAAAAAGGKVAASAASTSSSSLGSAAAAANPITAMVTAVASVVTAISSVVANFQFAAMNKTLDLIEKEVRYTKIYTGEQSNSILNTGHDSLEQLRLIAAATKGLVGINITGTLNDAETKRLIDDLLNGSGSFYSKSARTLMDIHQAIVGGFAVLSGQVNAASKQNIFQKIFSGGALSSGNVFSGLTQSLSSSLLSTVSGAITSSIGGARESTLGLVEKEVRFSQIHLLNILEKMNQYLPKLADIHQRLVEIMTDGMTIRGGGNNNVQITINTTGDTRQMLDALTRELKLLGVVPA